MTLSQLYKSVNHKKIEKFTRSKDMHYPQRLMMLVFGFCTILTTNI
jgi:hypothetical protein